MLTILQENGGITRIAVRILKSKCPFPIIQGTKKGADVCRPLFLMIETNYLETTNFLLIT
jgi:hypothetical protein